MIIGAQKVSYSSTAKWYNIYVQADPLQYVVIANSGFKASAWTMTSTATPPTTDATTDGVAEGGRIGHVIDMETDAVMKQRVAKSTRDNYERSNIAFLLWLFENNEKYPDLLEQNLYERMSEGRVIDQDRRTRKGLPCKKRERIRAVCRQSLQQMKADDAESIPLNLQKLTFTIFSRYLSTFKKKIKRKRKRGELMRDGEAVDVEVRLSASSYESAFSALSHLYTDV